VWLYWASTKLLHAIVGVIDAMRFESFHRIVSGAPITPREVRLAALFVLVWFLMDVFWFVCTLNHWFGL